jgi:hypothetical protein
MGALEGTRSEAETATPLTDEPERPLRCAACANVVTLSTHAIDIDGSHVHTRLNPANVVFQFGCFSQAPGCVVSGTPSSEHVWFAGCLWQYAHCARCNAHLGWAFSGALTFFGLVLSRLTGP